MKLLITFFLLFIIAAEKADAQDIETILAGLKSDRQKADTLYAFGMKHFVKSKFDSARFYFNRAAGFAEKTGSDSLVAKFYLAQSNAFILSNNTGEGLLVLNYLSSRFTNLPSYNLQERFLMLNAMGFERLHKIDSALYNYLQCELLNSRANPYKNWVLYSQMGFIFQQSDALAEAKNNL